MRIALALIIGAVAMVALMIVIEDEAEKRSKK